MRSLAEYLAADPFLTSIFYQPDWKKWLENFSRTTAAVYSGGGGVEQPACPENKWIPLYTLKCKKGELFLNFSPMDWTEIIYRCKAGLRLTMLCNRPNVAIRNSYKRSYEKILPVCLLMPWRDLTNVFQKYFESSSDFSSTSSTSFFIIDKYLKKW